MNKRFTKGVVALVAAGSLLATACGSDEAAVGSGDCDSVASVSLPLQWVPQAQFAGYFAAVDRGLYNDYCLDVTILEGGVDIVPQQQLASGAVDFAISWVPKALVSREQGADIVNVAQVFQRSGTLQVSHDNFVSCIKMKTSPLITNSNKTFIITPYDNLSLATNYKIKVTYGVEDTSGKLMKNEYETLNGFNISAIQIGSSKEDIGYGLKVDNSNNVYITGHTFGGLDSNNNLGSADVFLVKYDYNNKKIWTKQIGTPKEEKANGITIDSSNNIYISGYTKGKFDNDTYSSRPDIFLSKFNSGGTNQWIKSFGTPFDDYSNGIAVDSSGDIYISGYTKGDFDNDSITANPDIILLKYNSSGTKLWHKQIGTSFDDRGNGIAIDSSNNIYITGYSKGDLDNKTNSGSSDSFL